MAPLEGAGVGGAIRRGVAPDGVEGLDVTTLDGGRGLLGVLGKKVQIIFNKSFEHLMARGTQKSFWTLTEKKG